MKSLQCQFGIQVHSCKYCIHKEELYSRTGIGKLQNYFSKIIQTTSRLH